VIKSRRSHTVWYLALAAVVLFAGGELLLYASSDGGKLFLARNGVVLSRALVTETLSGTVRTALRRLGVPAGAQKIETVQKDDGPRVRWYVSLPPRASLLQVNAALAEAVESRGGRVFDAWEQLDRDVGTRVTLDLGIGRLHTHEVVLARRAGSSEEDIVRIALVLEGFAREGADSLATVALDLAFEFSGAVLANGDDPKAWAKRLLDANREVVAHVPMEPMNYPNTSPGSDAILVDMSSGHIRRLVRKHLGNTRRPVAYLPYMGGMALQDAQVMELVMRELEGEEVAYLEPAGLPSSTGLEVAAEADVPFLRLDGHLDSRAASNRRAKREIGRRLRDVADTARRRGFASCSAWLDASLIEVLEKEVPNLEKQGVRFVPLSSLLRPTAL
jgi:polysaccharide deacetylase 2 family uncharacterized protein YibQ